MNDIARCGEALTRVWGGECACENAKHMTRSEMDAMADLFIACGAREEAEGLMIAWVEAEEADREIEPGDLVVYTTPQGVPFIVDCTEAYSMTCPNCGRFGSREDLIELGGECVDEDCDGTIIPAPRENNNGN